MSVRHIHASPGEYIAVHRDGGRYHSGGGSVNNVENTGCLVVVVTVFLIWFVANYWEIILTVLICIAAGWLMWIFRKEIWKGICTLWNWMISRRHGTKNIVRPAIGKPAETPIDQSPGGADYGKIIQRR